MNAASRVMLAMLRALVVVADALTPSAYVWSLDLSRAYKRRRYTLSYRYTVGGDCMRAGFLVLYDATDGELYARPARRLDDDPPFDPVSDAYRWMADSGQLSALLALAERLGIGLQRYSETPDELAKWRATREPVEA